jgi:5-methylcytosine-specific restriction endonuclease McrA
MVDPIKGGLLEPTLMTQHPDSDEHLAFLVKLQRLLSEGDFTATYKFALLMALADLAVERGHDDCRELDISMKEIAQKFIDYYWPQSVPYGANHPLGEVGVLSQNMGATAKVIADIERFRSSTGIDGLGRARLSPLFNRLLLIVSHTVSKQPVTFLQNVAGVSDEFIYERSENGLRLKPGVSSHLRKFHGLIQQMTRDRWVRHITNNKRNLPILGQKDDLHSFLFETTRKSLAIVSDGLSKLSNRHCFYCHQRISGTPDVDHFIPFSLYGRDIAQNFVLAHGTCNRSKSDALAAKQHLEAWLEYLTRTAADIDQIAHEAGLITDQKTILAVTRWSYQQALDAHAHAWIRQRAFEPVTASHLALLA